MRKGFTLLETVFSVALMALVMGAAMGSWMLFMYKSHRVNMQASLDMDVRKVIERFRTEMRNTARESIVFYPEDEPYAAVGFALAADLDGDGLMDMENGGSNILWRQTVVYHVWNHSPHQMRRTLFSNRNNEATYEDRFNQVASVVTSGDGAGACLAGGSAQSSVLFENLFTGKLWHAESRFDGYAAQPNTREKITFGSLPLGPGEHTVNLTVIDKNPQSTGRQLRLDQVSASVAGWPLEAELRPFSGVNASPVFVGQGVAGGAYGLAAATASDGDTLSLTLYNAAIEECAFIGEGRNVIFSNSVVRFDEAYTPAGFDQGLAVVKLEGSFGSENNWECQEQTASSLVVDQIMTNCALRIPLMSDPLLVVSGENAGMPQRYGIQKDGFGPVFRLYKDSQNRSLVVENPMFWVVSSPASGFNSDFVPDVNNAGRTDLVFYQNGVRTDWARANSGSYVELRPDGPLIYLPMGSVLMLGLTVRQSSPVSAERGEVHKWVVQRTDNGNRLPGFWLIPDGGLSALLQENWQSDTRLQMEYAVPFLQSMVLNFADAGEYISHVFDTQSTAGAAKTMFWEAELPVNAGLTLYARSGDTLSENGFSITDAPEWDNVAAASNGGLISGNSGRYVQFRAVYTAQSASRPPALGGGLGIAGPYRSATPKLRWVRFQWDGEQKFVDVTASLLKSPDCGIFKVDVDGKDMIRGVTMEIEIFKDVRTQGGKEARLHSTMTAEVDPRNSGK